MVEDLMESLGIKIDAQGNPANITISKSELYCSNEYHEQVLAELESSVNVHDVCLIGPRGSGKSTLVRELAARLDVELEPIMLYQVNIFYFQVSKSFILIFKKDMSARDLWQQRSTLENGDTVWRPSVLFHAAIEGKIAVLDGLHRLNMDTLSTLQRLIHEREAQLFDGSRLFRHDRYEHIKKVLDADDAAMKDKKLFKVHEDFRVVALAEPPISGKLSFFSFMRLKLQVESFRQLKEPLAVS